MSIPFADAVPTTAASPIAPAVPMKQSDSSATALLIGLLVAWLVLAVALAWRGGVFRRGSIVGPPRLSAKDSAWVLIGMLLVGYFVAAVVGEFTNRRVTADPEVKALLLTVIASFAIVPVVLLGVSRLLEGGLPAFGLPLPRILAGAGVGLLCVFNLYPVVSVVSYVTLALIHWLRLQPPEPHAILKSLNTWRDPRQIALAIGAAVLAAPIAEEIIFRGVIQTSLVRLFGRVIPQEAAARWSAVVLTAALFAAIHLEPAFMPPLFVLALGLGYLYERTGNLWASMAAHALFNSMQIVLYLAETTR